jgi:hypothetical protein
MVESPLLVSVFGARSLVARSSGGRTVHAAWSWFPLNRAIIWLTSGTTRRASRPKLQYRRAIPWLNPAFGRVSCRRGLVYWSGAQAGV